ncbi:hypothetical protein GCM10025872_35480 [Barrientosiimonas endolithica]|uniref:Uncharacterized protein n=1 Tax=Barrientosiimonas endolithica TaxID=1535208 RepID=A0ABM8HFS9_9MICO|nr:hypothetical protein GCM10025872_35480 [Barrientosiimonas endolithica]
MAGAEVEGAELIGADEGDAAGVAAVSDELESLPPPQAVRASERVAASARPVGVRFMVVLRSVRE